MAQWRTHCGASSKTFVKTPRAQMKQDGVAFIYNPSVPMARWAAEVANFQEFIDYLTWFRQQQINKMYHLKWKGRMFKNICLTMQKYAVKYLFNDVKMYCYFTLPA